MFNPGAGALRPAASYVDIGGRTGRLPASSVRSGRAAFLATRMYPPVGARSATAARVLGTVRLAGLIVVVVTTVWLVRPGPATGGARGTAIAGCARPPGSPGSCPVAGTG